MNKKRFERILTLQPTQFHCICGRKIITTGLSEETLKRFRMTFGLACSPKCKNMLYKIYNHWVDFIVISKDHLDFLIVMANQGADEQCGDAWYEAMDKMDEISEIYKGLI